MKKEAQRQRSTEAKRQRGKEAKRPRSRGFVFWIFSASLLLCFSASILQAAEPSIQAQVDRDTVAMDDTLTLTVSIRGGSALSSPDIPALGHFDVVGRSSGNTVEIINGEMSSSKTFQFILSPRNPGDFSIGPIKVFIEGREYSAGPIRVKVTESAGSPGYAPQVPSQPSIPQMPGFPTPPQWPNTFPTPSLPSGNIGQETFVTAEADKKEVYLGEQILYTFRLYTTVNLQEAQLELPEFKDFINEELVKEKRYTVDLNGQHYAVNEWRLALFPTTAGTLETGPTLVKAKVPVSVGNAPFNDPFFSGFAVSLRSKTFSAPSIPIKVKELPAPPSDFSGLVGDFAISSSVSKEELNLGDTTNLKIEISGRGNIREAALPTFESSNFFKVYPDKPEVRLNKTIQGLQGMKVFTYALVAERPGTTSIPGQNLSFFNPHTGSYEKLSTQPVSIQIKGSPVGEKLVTVGLEGKKTAQPTETKGVFDIQALKPATMILYSQNLNGTGKILGWSFLLGSPLVYGLFLSWQRLQARALAQADDRKRSRAFKRAKAALSNLHLSLGVSSLSDIAVPIKEYLGDRFLVKGSALTPAEVEELLKSKEVPVEVNRRMVYLLEQLDQWKYGGFQQNLPSEKDLKQEVLNLLREIEKAV